MRVERHIISLEKDLATAKAYRRNLRLLSSAAKAAEKCRNDAEARLYRLVDDGKAKAPTSLDQVIRGLLPNLYVNQIGHLTVLEVSALTDVELLRIPNISRMKLGVIRAYIDLFVKAEKNRV